MRNLFIDENTGELNDDIENKMDDWELEFYGCSDQETAERRADILKAEEEAQHLYDCQQECNELFEQARVSTLSLQEMLQGPDYDDLPF